jgi:predicted nucleic acid-binding protein
VKAYLDASVVLRSLLHEPAAIVNWSRWELLVSSELLRVETFRALDRLHIT